MQSGIPKAFGRGGILRQISCLMSRCGRAKSFFPVASIGPNAHEKRYRVEMRSHALRLKSASNPNPIMIAPEILFAHRNQ